MLYLCCTKVQYFLPCIGMASVKIVFRSKRKNAEGKSPLFLRIIKNRRVQFISLGINLGEEEWDEKNRSVKSKHPNSARYNSHIATKFAEAINMSLELESKDVNVTASKIKTKIKGKAAGSFTEYAIIYRDSLLANQKFGTYFKVKGHLSKLDNFSEGRNLQFEDIDIDFLKRYEKHLYQKQHNSINTVHTTLRTIRKLFNDAVREGILELEQNPFLRYKLKPGKTEKIYLTDKEISSIEKLSIAKDTKCYIHRMIFVFACYAGGIRISDMLQLKWKDFDGTNIRLFTQKTRDHISIHLPKKALEILKELNTSDTKANDFIFPVLDSSKDYTPLELNRAISSATAYLNKNLKQIALDAGVEKHVSMHTSRHSWATRALKKGMRIEYVGALMGHSNVRTTQIYAKIVSSELDKAMEVFDEC